MSRVTKRFVDSIKPPEKGEAIYWDDELKGFAVRVWPSRMKSCLIHYRTRSGRPGALAQGSERELDGRAGRVEPSWSRA
jgi:hypothetical protein